MTGFFVSCITLKLENKNRQVFTYFSITCPIRSMGPLVFTCIIVFVQTFVVASCLGLKIGPNPHKFSKRKNRGLHKFQKNIFFYKTYHFFSLFFSCRCCCSVHFRMDIQSSALVGLITLLALKIKLRFKKNFKLMISVLT